MVDYISLVNLIRGKEVVKELIQDELHVENLEQELKKIIKGGEKRPEQLQEYKAIKQQMGTTSASQTTAGLILKYLQQ